MHHKMHQGRIYAIFLTLVAPQYNNAIQTYAIYLYLSVEIESTTTV